jgi:hypothetical protein
MATISQLSEQHIINNINILNDVVDNLTELRTIDAVDKVWQVKSKIGKLKTILKIKQAQTIQFPIPYEIQHKIFHKALCKEIEEVEKNEHKYKYGCGNSTWHNKSLLNFINRINLRYRTNYAFYKWGDMNYEYTQKRNLQEYLKWNGHIVQNKWSQKVLLQKIMKL